MHDGFNHPMVQKLAGVGAEQNAQECLKKIQITKKPPKKEQQGGLMDLLEELGVLAMLTPVPRGGVKHVCLPSTLVGMMLRDYQATKSGGSAGVQGHPYCGCGDFQPESQA